MSLINKLLTDLEERHNQLNGEDEVVLDGLSSVPATSSDRRLPIPLNFIIVSFFLAASTAVAYGVIREKPKQAKVVTVAAAAGNDIQPSARGESVSSDRGPHTDAADGQLPGAEINAPRLDPLISYPADGEPASAAAGVSPAETTESALVIRDVSFAEDHETLFLNLSLSGKAYYRAYTLEDPNRIVLEIDNAGYSAAIPEFKHISQIKSIRIGDRHSEVLKLVIDTKSPMSIEKTGLEDNKGGYTLSMILHPSSTVAEAVDRKRMPAALPEQVSPAKEEYFGQMNVRRSNSAESVGVSERLYQEAIALYRQGDVQKGNVRLFDLLARDPLHVNARLLLAGKLLEQNDAYGAEKVLRAGLDIKAEVPEWAKLYAHILTQLNRKAEAVAVLKAALPAVKQDADYYALLAALLQQESLHEEAVALYKKVLKMDSSNGVWWMGLAISLDALNRTGEALHAYGESLKGRGMTQDLHQYVNEQIARLTTRKNS